MSATFRWNPTAGSQSSEIMWNSGAEIQRCDEVRCGFVSGHVGIDAVFNGRLFAKFSFIQPNQSTVSVVFPEVTVTMGDQSQPSKFTLQCVIRFARPIAIKPKTLVTLMLAPFPITAVGTGAVVAQSTWFSLAYFLRGNEISL